MEFLELHKHIFSVISTAGSLVIRRGDSSETSSKDFFRFSRDSLRKSYKDSSLRSSIDSSWSSPEIQRFLLEVFQ